VPKTPTSSSTAARPGVLLDRDGTINVDHGYVGSIECVELIAGAADAIAAFNRAEIPVAVVTNQAGVARGYYGIDDVLAVHRHLDEELARFSAHVDAWYFCPYHVDGTVPWLSRYSLDRKPGPGMLLAAAQDLNLDLSRSWFVGDRFSDVGAAEAVGAHCAYLGSEPINYGRAVAFESLALATPFILRELGV